MQLLMVCHGNICRSPMAAAVATALLDEAGLAGEVTVESAGTSGEHEGEDMDGRARAALSRRGWPVVDHRARRLVPVMVEPGALVACADRANLRTVERMGLDGKVTLLRRFDPQLRFDPKHPLDSGSPPARAAGWADDEIPDPWYGGEGEFDRALDIIEAACRGLVAGLGRGRALGVSGRWA